MSSKLKATLVLAIGLSIVIVTMGYVVYTSKCPTEMETPIRSKIVLDGKDVTRITLHPDGSKDTINLQIILK